MNRWKQGNKYITQSDIDLNTFKETVIFLKDEF